MARATFPLFVQWPTPTAPTLPPWSPAPAAALPSAPRCVLCRQSLDRFDDLPRVTVEVGDGEAHAQCAWDEDGQQRRRRDLEVY